jgi:biopolymer transport protein ExbD
MRRPRRTQREPTITLINIVFLLLVFFLLAGTLAPPLDRDVTLVATRDLPPERPPDALVLHADGAMTWRGRPVGSVAAYLADAPPETAARPRIVPDRDVPARLLIRLGQEFRAAGAETVLIVTERGLR